MTWKISGYLECNTCVSTQASPLLKHEISQSRYKLHLPLHNMTIYIRCLQTKNICSRLAFTLSVKVRSVIRQTVFHDSTRQDQRNRISVSIITNSRTHSSIFIKNTLNVHVKFTPTCFGSQMEPSSGGQQLILAKVYK